MRARAAEIWAPNPVRAAPGPGCGSARSSWSMVTITCGLTVRRIGRVPAARALSASCTSASACCWARLRRSPCGPVGLHERFQRGLHLLPADRVEVEPAGTCCRRRAGSWRTGGPRSGRVRCRRGRAGPGSGAPPAPARSSGGSRRCRPAAHRPRPGRRPAAAAAARCSSRATGGDHRDLLGGDPAGGERGRHRRQVLQRPAGADQPVRGRGGQPAVPAQPGLHRRPPRRARTPGSARPRGRCGPAAASSRFCARSSRPVRSSTCGPNRPFRSSAATRSRRGLQDRRAGHPHRPNTCTKSTGRDRAPQHESPGQRPVHRFPKGPCADRVGKAAAIPEVGSSAGR